jgi:hypothetical protein
LGRHAGADVVDDLPEAVDFAAAEDFERGEGVEVIVGAFHPWADVFGGHEFGEGVVLCK